MDIFLAHQNESFPSLQHATYTKMGSFLSARKQAIFPILKKNFLSHRNKETPQETTKQINETGQLA